MNTSTKRVYSRVRAACCPHHGLTERPGLEDDPRPLDRHAAKIAADVVRMKKAAR